MLSQRVQLYDEAGNRRGHESSKSRPPVLVDTGSAVLRDLARGKTDIPYFAERWLGIKGNPGQIEWWNACAERDESGWRPRYLTTVVSAGNRAGKTLSMGILAFHHVFYKLGLRPADHEDASSSERWNRAPYEWYHVGVQQEIAELLHIELARILRGDHTAQQGRGCPLTKELPAVVSLEKKYRGEYLMIEVHPLFGGGRMMFRSTEDKAKALLGKDMNGISFDEAGRELYLPVIYQEVLNLRRLSTGGPLHFIGTPMTGLNDYYDLWERGDPANPDRDPQYISFRLSTRDNVGYGLDAATFEAVVRQTDPYLVPQNIDGHFIEAPEAYFGAQSVEAAFDSSLAEESQPEADHRYTQGVDPGIAADATWAITLDYTDRACITGVRARRSRGRQSIPGIVNMAREGSLLYQSGALCMTTIDTTGLGGKMFQQECSVIKPLRSFDFAGTAAKKDALLADLKTMLDRK